MIFDKLDLPRDTGATDFNDSARLAGIMVMFGHEEAKKIILSKYLPNSIPLFYVRHPEESRYDFSRDQAVCLVSGFYYRGLFDCVNADYVSGRDILTPSVRGHFTRCAGGKANWFQNLWLKVDIMWNTLFQPLVEPNQLICMCVVAGPEYVKLWTKHNKVWREAIRNYWSGWRGEPELAELMIKRLESYE